MHIIRINSQVILRLPPHFNDAQMLSKDELIDILLISTPKSWQHEMDRQGFDPLSSAPAEAAAFMERIKMLEDFDSNKKVATSKVAPGKGKKKSGLLKETRMLMAPSVVCCMATTTPTTLLSARHSWRKLRS